MLVYFGAGFIQHIEIPIRELYRVRYRNPYEHGTCQRIFMTLAPAIFRTTWKRHDTFVDTLVTQRNHFRTSISRFAMVLKRGRLRRWLLPKWKKLEGLRPVFPWYLELSKTSLEKCFWASSLSSPLNQKMGGYCIWFVFGCFWLFWVAVTQRKSWVALGQILFRHLSSFVRFWFFFLLLFIACSSMAEPCWQHLSPASWRRTMLLKQFAHCHIV